MIVRWLLLIVCILIVPPITVGIIRKLKARLQNRIGPPILQPFYDLVRLLSKSETVSRDTSWVFRTTAVANAGIMLILAALTPWLSFRPDTPSLSDVFLIVYLFALNRFFTVLAALDAGSTFGGFGASREVTLALLVEPAIVLCLASLGVCGRTTDLNLIFTTGGGALHTQWVLWMLVGLGLFLSALVELSRMPADDPTTHLELTMVHEAMILENSGPNLGLVEYAHMLKIAVLLGLSGQCMLHGIPMFWQLSSVVAAVCSIAVIFVLAIVIAVIECTQVKLRWTKLPEFIAYPVAMSLLSMLVAISK